YSPHKPGWDVSEIFQIRDYVEGDSLRQIHWKLSGKMDRLVVRDPSLPVMRSLLLFWDRSNTALSNESMDAQAETVASLCRTLLDNSIVFTIGWNEPAEQRCVLNAVNSMEDVVAMMPRMLSLQGTETGLTGAALLVEALNGNRFSRIIYVSDSPDEAIEALRGQSEISMLICGAGAPGAVCFDEENYREQLSELIL
ncbi:MAG: DUF58 domain-containing protein, partial [Oscillospiraceae bacterium]|nr:DUF58 domain-containing protein [Oscillospiraceae bacterium]